MHELANKLSQENELAELLKASMNRHVGYIYSMDYNGALILTNDAWKDNVGGIPHNSFLIASALDPDKFAVARDLDKEIILLRVLNAVPLPQDADLTRTRIEYRQRQTGPANSQLDYDPLTAAEMQYGGLNCRILGTFFLDGASGKLRFGSDIENFMASSKLLVYKPSGRSLDLIVNHVNPEIIKKTEEEMRNAGFKQALAPLEIGTVRYTSSNRMQKLENTEKVKVKIHPADFLARRTAVLGMTRTGKSNTVKTTIAAVANMATSDTPIGQLVFDINGEYANANHQDDGSSIADVFKDRCERYRGLLGENDEGFRDLRINFYLQPGDALYLLRDLVIAERGATPSQDVKNFLESSLEEPDKTDWGAHARWAVRKAIFQCILHKAGYKKPNDLVIRFPVSKNTIKYLDLDETWPKTDSHGNIVLDIDRAISFFIKAREIHYELKNGTKDDKKKGAVKGNGIGLESSKENQPWFDSDAEAYLNILAQRNSGGTEIKGYKVICAYRAYHSPARSNDIIREILGFLEKGKIVILDLSVGSASLRKTLAERIARQVFEKGMDEMHRGKTPKNMVLYIEEAHNLIGKDEALDNTWPRIAKEGAKARIALVYATQEPSSIHRNILANTENWFVCHLNNDDEIRALAKFYDFNDFAASLKTAQDVGFARVKTLSSPFVVPVQINKFSPAILLGSSDAI